ncbi:hypothetical protein MEO93_27740 [Dolichospermum sp. ST_sed3]|nr:hypothetical protein [Dolichospermum sp. ST_sed3]
MGNRPLLLPVRKTEEKPDFTEWGNLKNKFSGKTLFRLKLYHLETGDLTSLDIINNKWFFEEIFAYSKGKKDINLLPALKKISGSGKFDESLRQHASEIVEIIEEQFLKRKNLPETTSDRDEYEKDENARRILSETRYPQTTEVLRLLRDKSPELKRLALFIIGKFRLAGMIQETGACLSVHGLEDDAYSVLLSFGSSASDEIEKYCLTASGNINTRKTVIRLLSQLKRDGDMSSLVEQLWSNSRQIKETALKALLFSDYKVTSEEMERLKKTVLEVCGAITWIISTIFTLLKNKNSALSGELIKEYIRWKNYLLNLATLTFNDNFTSGNDKDNRLSYDDLNRSLPEILRIFFSNESKTKEEYSSDPEYFKKKLKKLQRYFPCDLPDYENLPEDIVNSDYNLLTIWTKAVAIRNIPEIAGKNIGESVVALLFSPELVLREEAALLIARSEKDLYRKTADRIPGAVRSQLDRINAGESHEKEYVYEKVKFLSSCFDGIKEDDLLFLAEKMLFVGTDEGGIYSQPSNTILWSFSENKPDPDVFVNHEDISDPARIIKDLRTKYSYCYVLSLRAVWEFNFLHPEKSFGIFRYIDKCEG